MMASYDNGRNDLISFLNAMSELMEDQSSDSSNGSSFNESNENELEPSNSSSDEEPADDHSPPPGDLLPVQPELDQILYERDTPPSHYLLKLESFSSLSKASVEKYRSDFEAGGYKWELSIYPTGDKERDGEDHISIYLELMETSSFANGWEVNAIFNFFVYNQKQDKYVGLQDAKVRRFHSAKTQWGIAKFMDLKTLTNTKNGYIVKGTCTFGAEVFVANQKTFKGECVSMIKNPESYSYKWKINRFSSRILRKQQHESETFLAGKYKWTISFYPKGNEASKGNNISLFLALDTSTLPAPNTKLLVHYNLRVVDQINNQHFQRSSVTSRFGLVSSLGYSRFMPLAKFKDPSNGFFVGDSCIIEADVQVLGVIKPM